MNENPANARTEPPAMLEYRPPGQEEPPVSGLEVLSAGIAIALAVPFVAATLGLVVAAFAEIERGKIDRLATMAGCFVLCAFGTFCCCRTAMDYLKRRNRRKRGQARD